MNIYTSSLSKAITETADIYFYILFSYSWRVSHPLTTLQVSYGVTGKNFGKSCLKLKNKRLICVRDGHGGGWSRKINARYLHTLMVYL